MTRWTVIADDDSGLWCIVEEGASIATSESESIAHCIVREHNAAERAERDEQDARNVLRVYREQDEQEGDYYANKFYGGEPLPHGRAIAELESAARESARREYISAANALAADARDMVAALARDIPPPLPRNAIRDLLPTLEDSIARFERASEVADSAAWYEE